MNLVSTRKGRLAVFGALYLSEGAPIGFIWWALPTVLAAQGKAIDGITTFAAMLVWPWALKFIWAPLIDAMRGPRWGHRYWIIAAQLVMGAALVPLVFLDINTHLDTVYWFLLVHALAATTQDVAIDAWAISTSPREEHGRLNASMAVGKYVGRWLFGAGLLVVWDAIGDAGRPVVVASLIATIWATMVLVLLSNDVAVAGNAAGATIKQRLADFRQAFMGALRQTNTWFGFVIAIVGGAGFEAVGAVARPLLIARGFDKADVGYWGSAWVGAMILGAWLGGWTCDRIGHRRGTRVFLLLLAVLIGVAAAVDAAGQAWLVPTALGFVYLGIGLFLATQYALLMDLTDPRIAGTQFSAFMGATNGCEMWAGFFVGQLVAMLNYSAAFLIMACLSLAALPALQFVRSRQDGGA